MRTERPATLEAVGPLWIGKLRRAGPVPPARRLVKVGDLTQGDTGSG